MVNSNSNMAICTSRVAESAKKVTYSTLTYRVHSIFLLEGSEIVATA